ncbi:MAG: exopolysaccharide biosynthesis protein [Caulobacter sp.]|nr:exopolysaccharide biosynthesis protein [Caulobacter sp.]
MTDTDHPPRVSDILAGIAAEEHATVSVSDVTHAFGDRAFGALMFVFAAPLALPMPPGASAVLGAPLLFITVQWMVGRRTLWLPGVIANRTMSRSDFVTLMGKLTPYLSWLERRLRRRITFLYGPVIDRLTGLVCVILATIVFLPIPFGNMLPSFAIAAFALGLAERDGLAALIGWLASFVSVAVLALLWKAILAAAITFFGVLGGTIHWISGHFG